MSNGFWEREVVLGTVPSGEKSAIRLASVAKDGTSYVDVRKFVTSKTAKPGTFDQHTKSGLALPADPTVLLTVAAALIQQAEAIKLADEAARKAAAIKRPSKKRKGA